MSKVGLALLAVLILPGLSPVQDKELAAAEKEFRAAMAGQAAKPLEDAIKKLVAINSPAAAKVVLGGLKAASDTNIYWMLVNGAATFTSPEALGEVTKLVLSNRTSPASRDLVAALHGNFSRGCESALAAILREGTPELQALAVEHMMDVGQKVTIEAVLEILKKGTNADLTKRLFRVLNVLCVETYGETLSNWEGWWNANKHKDWEQLKAKAQGAGGGGTGTVVDDLGKHRDSEYEKLKEAKVLIIGAKEGCKCKDPHDQDKIQEIAERMRLKVEYVNKIDFCKPVWTMAKLDEYVAILCNCMFIEEHCTCKKCQEKAGGEGGNRMRQCPPNCGCGHKTAKYLMDESGLAKIRKYVDNGGYLFTEDWGLREILAVKFKEYVDVGEFIRSDVTVNILPKPGAMSHPYLRNIFSRLKPKKKAEVEKGGTVAEGPESPDFERIDHSWVIDKDSPAIKIVNDKKVSVLIYSKDLGAMAKGADAVAITFIVAPKAGGLDPVATGQPIEQDRTKMSGGRVLHVMSHFGKQQKNRTDEFTIQNLLLNFLIEASERRGIKLEQAKK